MFREVSWHRVHPRTSRKTNPVNSALLFAPSAPNGRIPGYLPVSDPIRPDRSPSLEAHSKRRSVAQYAVPAPFQVKRRYGFWP